MTYADITKNFGPLLDQTTCKHVTDSGFTGPLKVLQHLFLTLDSQWRGSLQELAIGVFIGPPLFIPGKDGGPTGGFRDICRMSSGWLAMLPYVIRMT